MGEKNSCQIHLRSGMNQMQMWQIKENLNIITHTHTESL